VKRTFKITSLAVAAVATAVGVTLVGARLLRNYRSFEGFGLRSESPSSAREIEHLSPADHSDRPPTNAEFALIQLVRQYGWPVSHSGERYGTDAEGSYLLFPIGSDEARVQFALDSALEFVVVSWSGTPVTGPLAKPNPMYDAAVAELTGA